MKKMNLFIVICSLVLAVACGDKDKKSGGSSNLNVFQQGQTATPGTSEGLFNPQNGVVEVSGLTFQPNMVQPLSLLQDVYRMVVGNNQYRPAYNSGGTVKYKVRIVGYIQQGGYAQTQQYPQQYPQQGSSGYVLMISSIQPIN